MKNKIRGYGSSIYEQNAEFRIHWLCPSKSDKGAPTQKKCVLVMKLNYIHIYQPLRSAKIWHKVIFKRSFAGLNSEFSFS